jgi:hypothetical protein
MDCRLPILQFVDVTILCMNHDLEKERKLSSGFQKSKLISTKVNYFASVRFKMRLPFTPNFFACGQGLFPIIYLGKPIQY